jgi:hypothetical protein
MRAGEIITLGAGRPIHRRNVFDPKCDDIAAPELAVDCEIEHRQVAGPPVHLQSGTVALTASRRDHHSRSRPADSYANRAGVPLEFDLATGRGVRALRQRDDRKDLLYPIGPPMVATSAGDEQVPAPAPRRGRQPGPKPVHSSERCRNGARVGTTVGSRPWSNASRRGGRSKRCRPPPSSRISRHASRLFGKPSRGNSSRSPTSAGPSGCQPKCYEHAARSNSAWVRPSTSAAGGCNLCTGRYSTETRKRRASRRSQGTSGSADWGVLRQPIAPFMVNYRRPLCAELRNARPSCLCAGLGKGDTWLPRR